MSKLSGKNLWAEESFIGVGAGRKSTPVRGVRGQAG